MAQIPLITRRSLEAAHKLFEAAKALGKPAPEEEHVYFVSTEPTNPGFERIPVTQALSLVSRTYQDGRGRAWMEHLRARHATHFDVDGGRIQLNPP